MESQITIDDLLRKVGVTMSIVYENNQQIVIEIKKLMLEKQISQREIAEKLGIKPQGLTKLLTKKNFGFEDAEKILSAIGYKLILDFSPDDNVCNSEE